MGSGRCGRMRVILALLIGLVLFGELPPDQRAVALQQSNDRCLSADEALLLDRINTYRALNGLSPLTASPTLTAAARHHAWSMAEYNYFPADYSVQFEGPNHDQTLTWQQNIANAGYPDNIHTTRSQIIGAGTDSAITIQRSLRGIAAYDQVLTDRRFQAVGIGFWTNSESDEGTYWVLTFGSLRDGEILPCPGVTVPVTIEAAGRSQNSANSTLAHDGDFSTSWSTTTRKPPKGAFIWFDLGSAQDVSAIEWMFSLPGAADQFDVEISLDRESWTVIATKSNGAVNEWRSVQWRGRARYVRFSFSNPNADPVVGYLSEVRVFR